METALARGGERRRAGKELEDKEIISQAVGILVSTYNITEQQARDRLRARSSEGRRRMADAAADLVAAQHLINSYSK